MRRQVLVLLVAAVAAVCASTVSQPGSAAPIRDRPAGAPNRVDRALSGRVPAKARLVRRVVGFARAQVGVPYRFGGSSRAGYDCSGLVWAAYRAAGRVLPRSSWGQVAVGRRVGFGALRAGDLLFTNGGGHVLLVVSRTAAIEAPRSGLSVRWRHLVDLRGSFYAARRPL